MSHKPNRASINPTRLRKAAALREAGHTIADIALETGISSRTLSRRFRELKVRKGSATAEVYESARDGILLGLASTDEIEAQIKSSIKDDLELARSIREKVIQAIEALAVDDHPNAIETARALTALSTCLKNTQEAIHRAVGKENFASISDEATIPELIIREFTEEEIHEITVANEDQLIG